MGIIARLEVPLPCRARFHLSRVDCIHDNAFSRVTNYSEVHPKSSRSCSSLESNHCWICSDRLDLARVASQTSGSFPSMWISVVLGIKPLDALRPSRSWLSSESNQTVGNSPTLTRLVVSVVTSDEESSSYLDLGRLWNQTAGSYSTISILAVSETNPLDVFHSVVIGCLRSQTMGNLPITPILVVFGINHSTRYIAPSLDHSGPITCKSRCLHRARATGTNC